MSGSGVQDWYHANYYSMLPKEGVVDPKGPQKSYDPVDPYSEKKVVREGVFCVMTLIVVDIETQQE